MRAEQKKRIELDIQEMRGEKALVAELSGDKHDDVSHTEKA
jgi:hypothetical protein